MQELLLSMDSAELSEWIAFSQLEPLPDPYWCAAMQATVLANCHSTKEKFTIEDFLPVERDTQPQSQEQIKAAFLMFAPVVAPK